MEASLMAGNDADSFSLHRLSHVSVYLPTLCSNILVLGTRAVPVPTFMFFPFIRLTPY